jgi:hypothetical protein
VVTVVVGAVFIAIWFLARKGRAEKTDKQVQQEAMRREHGREASRLLKDINKSLGFPEGTGPTGIMVDGEYRIVNVGHTERMKNDPTYAFGNELAGMLLDMNDLEGALKEAEAQSDHSLATKIRAEMSALEKRAIAMAEKQQQREQETTRREHAREALVDQHQRSEMAQPLTMATMADVLKELMKKWEESLQTTITTGYWKDTEACDLIVSAYCDKVANAIKGGNFSGDSRNALEVWTNLTAVEANYRREQMDYVRANIAPPNPNIWWMVLECHPHAQPDDVKKAFREKMKECRPDRVAGMAPEIRKLANDMAQKLMKAMRDYETRIR